MNLLAHWPIFYNLHDDKEFFAFDAKHYHVDVRFTLAYQRQKMDNPRKYYDIEAGWAAVCATMQSTPMAGASYVGEDCGQLPSTADIIWKSLRCYRADIDYQFHTKLAGLESFGPIGIKERWAGQVLPKARTGWVCPHKNFPLGQFEPVNGVVTCPMHGLQVHVETGRVLGSRAHSCAKPAGWKPQSPAEPEQFSLTGL